MPKKSTAGTIRRHQVRTLVVNPIRAGIGELEMNSASVGASNSIASSLQVSGMQNLNQIIKSAPARANGAASATKPLGDTSHSIAEAAQLYAKLQQLQQKDPAKFKQVIGQIADQLTAAAKQEGSTPEGELLSTLAAKFQTVAQNGDLSQLQPKEVLNRVQGAYGPNQAASQQALLQVLQSGGQQGVMNNNTRKQLASILNDVNKALPT